MATVKGAARDSLWAVGVYEYIVLERMVNKTSVAELALRACTSFFLPIPCRSLVCDFIGCARKTYLSVLSDSLHVFAANHKTMHREWG